MIRMFWLIMSVSFRICCLEVLWLLDVGCWNFCNPRSRNRDGELTSPPQLTLHLYRAPMRRYNELHDAQPQSAAAGAAREALIHLVKPFENPLRVARRQTNAVILDRKNDAAIIRGCGKGNLFGVARILPGVIQQVHHG